jgi:predicted phosphodiesterase
MIQHQFLGGHDITVIPISDVHLGSEECMEQDFIKFIQTVKETPNVYLVLGGDLIDNGTRSGVTNIFRATMPPSQQKKEMANILKDVSDRILCFVSGNHERRSTKDADDDPVYDIAAKLDIEHLYRENVAFVKIQLGKPETSNGKTSNGSYRPTYVLVVTHGAGGGIFTGAAVNRNERFGYVIDGMDALIVGHTHKPFTTQPGKIKIDPHNNKIAIKPFKVISSTSWLDYGGYAAQKMLLPSTHCIHTLTLRGDHKEIVVTM